MNLNIDTNFAQTIASLAPSTPFLPREPVSRNLCDSVSTEVGCARPNRKAQKYVRDNLNKLIKCGAMYRNYVDMCSIVRASTGLVEQVGVGVHPWAVARSTLDNFEIPGLYNWGRATHEGRRAELLSTREVSQLPLESNDLKSRFSRNMVAEKLLVHPVTVEEDHVREIRIYGDAILVHDRRYRWHLKVGMLSTAQVEALDSDLTTPRTLGAAWGKTIIFHSMPSELETFNLLLRFWK